MQFFATPSFSNKSLLFVCLFEITALQTLDCDWSVHKLIEMNFSKLTDNKLIFSNDFDCTQYHLCEISSQIIECKIFPPYDFLEINSLELLTLRNGKVKRQWTCTFDWNLKTTLIVIEYSRTLIAFL